MHDHVLNFKADFDILGTSNTMELVTVTPTTEKYVWSDQPRNTMKLVRHDVASEDESRLYWAQNGQTQYRIVNKEKTDRYGECRGYRIVPSQGTIHLAINNSSNLVNAANWAYHDLQITKRKDSEPR
jgi:primary-amine oxidase